MKVMNKFEAVILDADFCIKLGSYESASLAFIKFVVNSLCTKAYIHKYVYEDEILTPIEDHIGIPRACILEQLKVLAKKREETTNIGSQQPGGEGADSQRGKVPSPPGCAGENVNL